MELNKYILRKAIALGLCEEWKEKLSNINSVDELLSSYLDGIDFCLSNNFPSNNDLLQFGKDKINDYGIFVNQSDNLANKEKLVLLGNCDFTVNNDEYGVSQIFVKHDSKLEIICKGNSFTMIDCFENSNININSFENSNVTVNVYGSANVIFKKHDLSNINIVCKLKDSY